MSDATTNEFTPEQLLQQAQGNATAFALTSIAYIKAQHLSVDEYVAFVGRQFAPGWEQVRGQPVKDIARIAALNMVSVGGTLRTLSGDDTRAEVLIGGWPADEWLSEFGLTQQDTDPVPATCVIQAGNAAG